MNQIIIPTGYMGSGSSAITNIVSEIDNYGINADAFEFVMLHCPDGLFDLEDKLLIGNNAVRSDEAIHRFLSCMSDLYCKQNYWVSGYKEKISTNFLKYCEEFIEGIIVFSTKDTYWYFQQKPDSIHLQLLNYFRRFIGKFTIGKIKLRRPVRYNRIMIALPDRDTFYSEAGKLLNSVFRDLGIEKHNLVLDQFLLPHNLFRLDNYFDSRVRVFVVDRDPRDMFLLNKYVWRPQGVAVPFPLDARLFCDYYKKMRTSEKYTNDRRVFRVHFEDLVYRYDDILKKIYDFIGVYEDDHIRKKLLFNPDISIKNTQIFRSNKEYSLETQIITDSLKEYLYPFPTVDINRSEMDNIF